eukprot:CAMPEP_0173281240 /NCGR_PEP_ID=MMETSP1143-20121109/6127_1 /TAXON_ID=483371 /ORGANISM="non described non described, Strain CCMP2298" /LENGTH=83 /DNA_ID=CAMNT_0014218623 /DNA_START=817 /DNA_END=1068 /DNA_ORIENTATION=-
MASSADTPSAVAAAMRDKRTVAETKSRYKNIVKDSIAWFKLHRPRCLNAELTEFILPILLIFAPASTLQWNPLGVPQAKPSRA